MSDVEETRRRAGQDGSRRVLTGVPALTLEEGRQGVHKLAAGAGTLTAPSSSLLERAQSVGPNPTGGLLIVPEIDALATLARLEQAEQERDELVDELKDLGIVLLAQERLGELTPVAQPIPLEELARQFGREHLIDE